LSLNDCTNIISLLIKLGISLRVTYKDRDQFNGLIDICGS